MSQFGGTDIASHQCGEIVKEDNEMKRRWLAEILVIQLLLIAVPSWAAPIDYSIGTTTQDILGKANEVTVEKWLESILGLKYNDPSVNLISRNESYFKYEYKSLDGWDPELASTWRYAVVKYGTNYVAYRDNGDGLLTTGSLEKGISNVTFFGNGVQVPEPATMILLGLGLLGLGIATRRKS
jgi:hypothetical protein